MDQTGKNMMRRSTRWQSCSRDFRIDDDAKRSVGALESFRRLAFVGGKGVNDSANCGAVNYNVLAIAKKCLRAAKVVVYDRSALGARLFARHRRLSNIST